MSAASFNEIKASGDLTCIQIDEDTAALLELFCEGNYAVISMSILGGKERSSCRLQREPSELVDKHEDYEQDVVLFIVHFNGPRSIGMEMPCWHPTGLAVKPSDASERTSDHNGPTTKYNHVRKVFESVVPKTF